MPDGELADLQPSIRSLAFVLDGIPSWIREDMLLVEVVVDSSTKNQRLNEIGILCVKWIRDNHPDSSCALTISDQRMHQVAQGSFSPTLDSEVEWTVYRR